MTAIELLDQALKQGCEACPWKLVRTQSVPSEGPADAEVMFVGRSPGGEEDREGRPFVGRGGKALDKFIAVVGLNRARCRIANTARCYGGPGDPPPSEELLTLCSKWVRKEVELIKPKALITLGNDAMHHVLGFSGSCLQNQGSLYPTRWQDVYAIVLTHPGWWVRRQNYLEEVMLEEMAPKVRKLLRFLGVSSVRDVFRCEKCGAYHYDFCKDCRGA